VKDVNKIGLLQDPMVIENFAVIGLVSINPWAGFMVDYLKETCLKGMALVVEVFLNIEKYPNNLISENIVIPGVVDVEEDKGTGTKKI